jgi:hypothetical protein
MPLETIGSYALAGSSGAVARNARTSDGVFANVAFAASSARGGKSNGIIDIPSPAPNLAAYVSPFIRFDVETRLAIVEFRDSESGQVEQQYPSPRVVREYQQNLPENSILRMDENDAPDVQYLDAETLDVGDGKASAPQIAQGSHSTTPAPVPQAIANAAVAAFTPKPNIPAVGREIAVA